MANAEGGITVSEHVILALYYIHQYRYLTVAQVARIAGMRAKSASEMLLRLQRQKLLGHFGNTGIRGYGKTPKVYFLKKRGHEFMRTECGLDPDTIGRFKEVNVSSRWSPQMYHRLATLDVMSALEAECRSLGTYTLPATFIEYRRQKRGDGWVGETTDLITEKETIIPDAGFVLENTETKRRALFLIEVDMGTETIATTLPGAMARSIVHKIRQYDRYLVSKRYQEKYKEWGKFGNFVLLVITSGETRCQNMRRELSTLPNELHQFYRFATFDAVMDNFLQGQWWGRNYGDDISYKLVKGEG